MTLKEDQTEFDSIVIGSGAAGLSAALSLRKQGKSVVLLEATDKIGGTGVFSGGQVWVPNHHYMDQTSITDSTQDVVDYLKACSPNRTSDNDQRRWQAFADNSPKMLKFVEENTPLRFAPNNYPDAFSEWPKGKEGGRNLEAVPFNPGKIKGMRKHLRYPPSINRLNLPLTWSEIHGILETPFRGLLKKLPLALWRILQGKLSGSRALIAGLYDGCVSSGVSFLMETRAQELIIIDNKIVGVKGLKKNVPIEINARDAVILACGGFDWNKELKEQYLPGKIDYSAAVPSNRGDGHTMAIQAGAKIEHMDEAWYWAGFRNRKYFYEGTPLGSLISNLRSYPHTMIVNKKGLRFGNETGLNFAYEMQVTDEQKEMVNLPAWAIFDHQFRAKFNAIEAGIHPMLPLPRRVKKYNTLEAMCEDLSVNNEGLKKTLGQFNEGCKLKHDPVFGRGNNAYDRCYGSHKSVHPNLGTIERPPFYAMELEPTMLGTKGGPVTDHNSQVIDAKGKVIDKLYAIGNVADCIMYYACSGGDTLGPGMTAGFIVGQMIGASSKGLPSKGI